MVDISGFDPGTTFDQLVVGGAVTLGGTLSISRQEFVPVFGDYFAIILGESILGQFESLVGSRISDTQYLGPAYRIDSLLLVVDGEPGLSNIFVPEDAADSVIDVRNGFKLPGPRSYFFDPIPADAPFTASLSGNLLTLDYKENAFSSQPVTVTVRAVNDEGVSAEATFSVKVSSVNDLPEIDFEETPSNGNLQVPFGTLESEVDLGQAFTDVETPFVELALAIVGVSNGTLFRTAPTLDAEGRLHLEFAPDAFGTSRITIRVTDGDGGVAEKDFVVELAGAEPKDSYDAAGDNDTFELASNVGPLNAGLVVSANIHAGFGGDVDVYQFTTAVDGVYRFEVVAERAGGTLDAVLEWIDGQGRGLGYSDDAIGNDPAMQEFLAAGTYYLKVSGFGGSLGAYTLRLTRVDQAPQILRMTPSRTVAGTPPVLELRLDDSAASLLDPASVSPAAFLLEKVDGNGVVLEDVSAKILSATWNETTRSISLALDGGLEDGGYRLTATEAIRNQSGIALDGNRDGLAGGSFTGDFAIDSTAPEGTIAAMAVTDGLFTFAGTVSDGFPAMAGETILLSLDVDGDGFDDGALFVTLGAGDTPWTLTTASPIPFGQEGITVRARFEDLRGNASVV
ncbi:MAG: hypothetical protein U1D30_07995 [Planctomycetota bacterium]